MLTGTHAVGCSGPVYETMGLGSDRPDASANNCANDDGGFEDVGLVSVERMSVCQPIP